MRLSESAFANASAVLTGIVYLACSILIVLFPDFFKIVSQSWFHGINLETIWTGGVRGNFLLGLFTAVAGTWVTGWLFASLYNKLAK